MVAVFERTSKRPRRAAWLFAAAIAVTAALAMAAASASAGDYDVYSCRTPTGESAPADGWSGSATGTATVAEDACSQPGGALIAGLGDQVAHPANMDRATWTFETPAYDRLASATLWRAGYVHGGADESATYELWLAGPIGKDIFNECLFTEHCNDLGEPGQPLAIANRLAVPAANLGSQLSLNASCATGLPEGECQGGFGDPNGYAAVVYLYAADLTLEQSAGPSASNVSGELASAPTVAGTSDVVFSASDPGSGVYEAVFSVDGKVVQSTVVNEDGGRCRSLGQATDGLPAFLYVQPCPASVSADVGFDTASVSDGEHHLVVSVIDAAGNAATVLDRNITVDNPSPPGGPNGTNASAQATLTVGWAATRGDRLTSRYGRAQTIVGRLTGPGGVGIDAAQIDVLATADYAGAREAAMASPRTGADGRFSLHLPAGVSSRTLRIDYSDELDSPPVVTKTLTLIVRAGVTLRIRPRTASVGRSIHFSGRLRGGPIPGGGKPLVLEARSPGGAWLEFHVIRSDARGRYHASYTFKFPGPAHYQFRVLCEAEADYPYATGASDVVGVWER
jgi:hypothetical protein